MDRWTAAQIGDQSGRGFVVTGANSGLGFETARQLAAHRAHVVLAGRSEEKGLAAMERIKIGNPDALVEFRLLDLADLDSVREFAGTLHRDAVALDVLVNNAGVMFPPRLLTRQGFESQFATNHLGHFALTGLLFDTIRQGNDARVVTVSSLEHRGGSIHFDDLTGARSYSPRAFYRQAKFANVLFALELDRRLRAAGIPVRSVLAHPGWSATNLQSSGPTGDDERVDEARQPPVSPRAPIWARWANSMRRSTPRLRAGASTARGASGAFAAIRGSVAGERVGQGPGNGATPVESVRGADRSDVRGSDL